MTSYAPPAWRPAHAAPRPSMGALGSLNAGDWLLLVGGAIVAGAGINTVIGGVAGMNAVGVLLGAVITVVGGTVLVSKFGKLIA